MNSTGLDQSSGVGKIITNPWFCDDCSELHRVQEYAGRGRGGVNLQDVPKMGG